jgi:hypothetical protein
MTPATVRIADVIRIWSPDDSLSLDLRNRPFGGEPVGAQNDVFIGAGIAAVTAAGISLTSARAAQ